MLKPREELTTYLRKKCNSIVLVKREFVELSRIMLEEHNIPTSMTSDLVNDRIVLNDTTDFILFALTKSLDEVLKVNKTKEFFTDLEISGYINMKLETPKFEFPIEIKCIRVDATQYIGATDVKFLMQLRNAGLISYNANAQRTMQRVVRGEKSYYKIALNKKAIAQIRESFRSETYIPNTITLNIPEDSTFHYNAISNTLVIESLDHFDISDGYHRYMAMCQEVDSNPDFNYQMELRLISFDENRVKQFIFQEDQKTQMKRIDSASMNMNNPANLVCERLNKDIMFNLKGKVTRNSDYIDFAELASIIDFIYFKTLKRENTTASIIEIEKELCKKFNYLTEYDTSLLEKRYSFKELIIIIYMFSKLANGYDASTKAGEIITGLINRTDELDKRVFATKQPKKSMLNNIDKLRKI